jgi:hypothetical protein
MTRFKFYGHDDKIYVADYNAFLTLFECYLPNGDRFWYEGLTKAQAVAKFRDDHT